MTAKEAKAASDNKLAVAKEENELYIKIQQQIAESVDRGSYGTRVFCRGASYPAIKAVIKSLSAKDGFECWYGYEDGSAVVVVSWEHA